MVANAEQPGRSSRALRAIAAGACLLGDTGPCASAHLADTLFPGWPEPDQGLAHDWAAVGEDLTEGMATWRSSHAAEVSAARDLIWLLDQDPSADCGDAMGSLQAMRKRRDTLLRQSLLEHIEAAGRD